jgi:glycosyltransferase involved in cell wall biosynthesis
MKNKITFIVFTYNESRRIEYILKSFEGFGAVVIMDNYSTDNTADIARSYGAKVFLHHHPGYAEEETVAKNAIGKAETDWIYWGYADELLPKTLLRKLVALAADDNIKVVNIPKKNLHYGMEDFNLESGGASPRLFRKKALDFTGTLIHQFGKVTCCPEEVVTLEPRDEFSIYHCSTYTISKFEIGHSKYSDIEARQEGKFQIRKLLFPVKFFVRHYLFKRPWQFGIGGFIYVMQYCFFYFNIQAKKWEIENGITLDSIEAKYDAIKEKLLAAK